MEGKMYKGKSDRNPYKPLLKLGFMGLCSIGFSVLAYMTPDINNNTTTRLGRKAEALNDIFGPTGVVVLFVVLGIVLIGFGCHETRKLITLRDQQIEPVLSSSYTCDLHILSSPPHRPAPLSKAKSLAFSIDPVFLSYRSLGYATQKTLH